MQQDTSAIARRAQQGDQAAFEELHSKLMPVVRSFYWNYFRNDPRIIELEDFAQEVFTRAFERIGQWKGETAKFDTWFTRLAINRALEIRRGRLCVPRGLAVTDSLEAIDEDGTGYNRPLPDTAPDPLRRLIAKEKIRKTPETAETWQLLELRYIEGWRIKDFRKMFPRLKDASIKNRLWRAQHFLHEHLLAQQSAEMRESFRTRIP